MARQSYIQCPVTNKLIPKDEYYEHKARQSAAVHSFTEFKSPIDGSVISDRKQLAEHNRKHGVTNVRDYGEGYFERRGKEKYAEMVAAGAAGKKQRVEAIKQAMHFYEHRR